MRKGRGSQPTLRFSGRSIDKNANLEILNHFCARERTHVVITTLSSRCTDSTYFLTSMAKTKPSKKSSKRNKSVLNSTTIPRSSSASKKTSETPTTLLFKATTLLHTSQPDEALALAQRALALSQPSSNPTQSALPALNLIAEIYVELGDIDAAREYFSKAVDLDPEGNIPEVSGGGAEKFLWLAQLCEDGGAKSVQWFERGATVLRKEIGALEERAAAPDLQLLAQEKRRKLANALCGAVEVYMTDLSYVNRKTVLIYSTC